MGKQKIVRDLGIQLKNVEALVILCDDEFEKYCIAENCKIFWTNPEGILGPFTPEEFEAMSDDQILDGIDDTAARFTIAIPDEDGEWELLRRNCTWLNVQEWFEDLTGEQIDEYAGRWYNGER